MNPFQEIFDRQKAYFDTDATKSYEWRIDQLTRLENLLKENELANYSNCSTTISGFDPSRSGGPQVPAPLEVKTCILPIWLRP
jgi:hypothetical protein